MKKRVLALLLCAVMLMTGLPVTPLSPSFAVTASAEGVVVDSLQELYDSIPAKAKWESLYLDSESLEGWYDMAAAVLASPDDYTQAYVNNVELALRKAYDSIEYHTQKIAITDASVKLNVGSSYALKASLEPENAADSVTWLSSDSTIVSVTPAGEVTAKKYSANPVTVTASSNGQSDTCKIYVLNPIGSVSLTAPSSLYEGQTSTFKVNVTGKDSSASTTDDYMLTWDSTDPSVADVSDSGVVTAKKQGTTVITVTAESINGTFTAKSTLRVDDIIEITSLKATTVTTSGKVIMNIGQSLDFKVSINPTNASIKNLKWSCSDTSILTVTDKGYSGSTAIAAITAKKAGTVTLKYTAKDGSGVYGYVKVTVQPRVSSISLESSKVISLTNKTEIVKVTILPKDAGNQVLSWSSGNPDICDVDYSGRLIPKSLGVCTIYVKTTDGSNLSGECKVRVASLATAISINKSTYTMNTTQSVTLKATVTTNDGSKYTDLVAWTSENPKIATVDANGKVTGHYPGKTIIRARTIDGTERSVVCAVTVNQPVQGIAIAEKKTLGVGQSYTHKVGFTPSYATNKSLKWSSSDTSVATVSSSGTVTGKKVGTAVITCKSVDGGYTAKCTYTIIIATTSVSLNKTRASVNVGKSFTLTGTVSPSNATNKTLKWSSSDTSVAKVSSSGVVTGIKGGTCTITCKNSGGQSAFCKVTVVQKVTGITLNRSSISLYTGKAYTLKPTVLPDTATNKTVSWSSSNSKIASVSTSGVVTGVAPGSAVIIAATEDGGFIAKCTVTVTKKVDVTGVKLNKKSLSLNKGGQYLLVTTISPSNASEKGITWTSSNTKVATVSSSGLVKAVGNGAAVITAKTKDGGFTAKCTVNVSSLVTGIRVSPTEFDLAKGQSKTLIANVFPTDASNRSVKWTSSDPKVVSVNSKGVATGLKSGKATVTATTVDGGYSASCDITVYIPVTGVSLSSTEATVPKGNTILLTAKVVPSNASNNAVRWSSSDSSVVTVNTAGQITGKKVGTAVITVSTTQGNYSDNCIVTVVQLADKVVLDYAALTLYAGKTKTLGATLKPSTTTNKKIIWTSSDKSVATVNSKGQITAVAGGTATIKATSGDKNTASTCTVTVIQNPTQIKLNKTQGLLKVGATGKLTATVLPKTATDKSVTWKSGNTRIAKVGADGTVKGIAAGTTTITAYSANGQVKASCKLTVIKPVTGVSLSYGSVTLNAGKKLTLRAILKPSDAYYQQVTWKSSNYDVADVSAEGTITAKTPGYAEITVKTKDGGYKAVCQVLVVQPVTSVSLNVKEAYIEVGSSGTIKATVKPSNATDKSVIWSSSDKSVVKVDSNGKVTGVKVGTATITVKTVSGAKVASCKIHVVRKVKSITLNKSDVVLYLNKTATLKAYITPSDATVKTVKWSSSNTAVLRVSDKGLLTPVKPGKAVITATTVDGGLKARCTVSVEVPATSLKISKSSLTLYSGKTYTLTSSISPSNTTNKTIKWTSSNEKVATVSASGKITAVGGGKATITAKTSNGLTRTCTVTVLKSVSSVNLNKNEVSVYTGSTVKLSASVVPSDASNKNVTWSSGNKSVATVDEAGNVKALKAGTAVITVKTVDGGFKDTCKVTVLQHVTSVTLNKTSLVVSRGAEDKLVATVLPSDASDKTVSWESSDPDVVSVSVSGEIVAKAIGSATVTAVTADGEKKASCVINVYESVTGVALDVTEKILYIGESVTVKPIVSPSDASNQNVSFSTDDASVANVGSDGTITALKVGTATITAKTADGGFTDTCQITVRAHVSDVTLSETEIMVGRGKTHQLEATVLPSDAFDKTVSWESSDEDIVSVSQSGKIEAKALGEATVTVITADGEKKASCTVTVYESVTGVVLDLPEKILYVGESASVKATVSPSDASNKDVSFTSSDETVASVSNDGTITALKVGTATVTVTTADGGFTDTCEITVRAHVSAISLDESDITLKRGETKQLTALVTPLDSFDKSIVWTSENEQVATVSDGVVEAIARGETVITATSVDGGFTASCKVAVTQPVTGISLSSTELSVYTGESVSLKATVLPENASDQRVSFKSSDESVAEVDENGNIKGIGGGTALISAETADGNYMAVCHVTVNVTAESIELNFDKLSLARGEKATAVPTVLPENTYSKKVTWTSEDEEIASVDEKGIITANKAGKTTIVCKAVIGDAQSEIEVEVYEPVSAIEVKGDSTELWVGQTLTLMAVVSPENATNKDVIWESENEQTATVENGVVTAKAAGTVTITAYSFDKKVSGEFTLTVKQQVTGIRLDTESVTLNENGEITLEATVLPENAYNKNIVWSSTDETVAKVDETGKITAVGKGECQIKADSADGFATAQCDVTVIRPVTSVNISNKQISLEKGDTFKLTAAAYPVDASDTAITWLSSDPEVCQVGEDGTVTALKGGRAVITAQSSEEGVFAECAVTVEVTSTSIALDISQIELWENETVIVSATLSPEDVTDTSVTWSCNNPKVATVENGKITAIAVGAAVITATANDSGNTAKCVVTVSRKTEKVIIEQTEITIENGESFSLTATVLPADATYKTLSWTTSDIDVAAVDESGTVTAKGAGTAVITATTDEGGNKAVCTVTVTQKPKSITLSEQSVTLTEGETAELTASFLPLTTTEKELIWETSDEKIATVKDGVITAVSLGRTTVTARSTKDNSVFARCEVNVLRSAGSVSLDKNELTLTIGQEDTLTAVVGPDGASNQAVTWSTSDESVAVVDENGLVKAVGEGTALIIVTTEDGGFVDVCFVMVQQADE